MKPKYLILIIPLILASLLSPKLTLAQEGLELILWLFGAYLFAILIWTVLSVFIETFVFWLLVNKLFKAPVKFLKILLYATVANITFPLFWIGFGLSKFQTSLGTLGTVFICFIFSVSIEWVIYILFLRKIIKIFNLLKISFIINLISTFFVFWHLLW